MKYKQSDSVIFQGELYFQTCVIMGQNFFFSSCVQDIYGELPQPVSTEALGNQAQLSWTGLPALWSSAAGSADAAEGERKAAGSAL